MAGVGATWGMATQKDNLLGKSANYVLYLLSCFRLGSMSYPPVERSQVGATHVAAA